VTAEGREPKTQEEILHAIVQEGLRSFIGRSLTTQVRFEMQQYVEAALRRLLYAADLPYGRWRIDVYEREDEPNTLRVVFGPESLRGTHTRHTENEDGTYTFVTDVLGIDTPVTTTGTLFLATWLAHADRVERRKELRALRAE
jgi:hypothetical protein